MNNKSLKKAMNQVPSRVGTVTMLLALAIPALAAFNSGSTGADGALDITTPGKTIFDPKVRGIDNDSDNVFHFTTINIAAGCTLRLGADIMGTRPVYFLASGNVTISGVVDLNGGRGHNYDAVHIPSFAGAGGYSGGIGYQNGVCAATAGEGPGGGGAGMTSGGFAAGAGAGGGYKTQGTVYGCSSGCAVFGKAYGNKYLLPLYGGSGGGGGYYSINGSGGGAGGGALLIACSGTIQLNFGGNILAKGGAPGNQYTYGSGGGGSGGAVRLAANTIAGSGVVDVWSGSYGASDGYIRIEAYTCTVPTGNFRPVAQFATPGLPLFPTAAILPMVKIVSFDGIAVPSNPFGNYTQPDVTINKGDTTLVAIKAKNIPLGTIVNVTMNSEDEGSFSFVTTPLVGTLDSATATARIKIPPGYSRFTCTASW